MRGFLGCMFLNVVANSSNVVTFRRKPFKTVFFLLTNKFRKLFSSVRHPFSNPTDVHDNVP